VADAATIPGRVAVPASAANAVASHSTRDLAAVRTMSAYFRPGARPADIAVPGGPWLGLPVRVEPLPIALRLAGAGQAWRIWYLSTAWDGSPTVVSGTITVPTGTPPPGGWPVVSYAHGFGGTADQCAPSNLGPSPWERTLNETLLGGGYAIAATDYDGIGTPGESSVINGRSEGYAVIDAVRAARYLAPVSGSWISVGYSLGGHAALWSGHLADTYAPSLRHVGTIALASFVQFPIQLASEQISNPAAPVTPGSLYSGVTGPVTHPDFVASDWFTPQGLQLVDQARQECIGQLAADTATVTNGQVFIDPAAAEAEFARLLAPEEVPIGRYPEPVRLAHGTADLIPAQASQVTAAELAAAGTDVTYTPVAGADHFTLLPSIAPQVLTWTRQLFARH
jgi:hypothetical protein